MSEELEVDPIGKLLEPSNLKVLDKIVNELPALDKVLEWINQMQRDGTLDSALNFMSQALSLLDAVQKSDLVNALISFGMDQLPKIQAVWPLLEKLGSEKTLNLMQQMDWDSLFSAMESLMPIFQKMTGERAVKLLNSMDWDSLLTALETSTPLLKELSSDKMLKAMEQLPSVMDSWPVFQKLINWMKEAESSGTLDSALNFMSQALSLLDAVQKSDLVNALISFGMDQLPKIQAVWPLLEKLGSEKTLNLMQQMDWDSLFSAMESLMPIFQKMTGERAVKLLNSMDWDSLLGGLEAITPLMKQMMSDRTTKIMSSIDVDSLLTLAEKLSGLQKTQGWNSMVKTLTDERTINNLSIVMSRMMLALQIWLENLPKTRELGLLGITGQLRSNKDVQLGMGILMGLAEAVGRAFRQSTQ
ncbi:hypothetical protein HS7_02370 [Sulfolobales archaeon HS-7]|nr:hypothetical protein HS7_02370 [Sulfolobales archaeon HS-7]